MRSAVAIVIAGLLLLACGSSASRSSTGSGGGSRSESGSGSGGGSGSARGAGSARCGPAGAKTLAASSLARVYVTGQTVFGCSTRGSRSFALGPRAQSCIRVGRIQLVRVAGEMAAFSLQRCGIDTGRTVVSVRRLSDGAAISSDPAITNAVAVESYQSVTSLVVKPDGAVAWVATLGSVIAHRGATEVHRHDRRGSALLDSGAGLAPGPLRLRGSTLRWRHGGATRSASLD